MSVQLASMGDTIVKEVLVATFFKSFGDRPMALFGAAIYALLTKKNPTWESVTARLLQEYIWQEVSKSANNST